MSAVPLGFLHRWIPPSREGTPTLLLLHGTGGDEQALLPLGGALVPGAALLSPRGKVLENGMPRYFRRLAEGVFDLEDLRLRTRELAEFLQGATEAYGFDPEHVIAVGYSNGANIAGSLMLLYPGLLRGAILFHAQVPLEPEDKPDLAGTRVFLSGGRADPLVPPTQSQRLADLLGARGADVRLHWEPGGHALSQGEVTAAREWLRVSIDGGGPAEDGGMYS